MGAVGSLPSERWPASGAGVWSQLLVGTAEQMWGPHQDVSEHDGGAEEGRAQAHVQQA